LLGVAAMGAGAATVLLLPFLAGHTPRARRLVLWVGVVALAFMAMMTGLALTGSVP
ncbi:MAG: hypothetical protein HYX77_07995, partial [Acidobacteria bacterium]|nr:hypothetical protein [Acidobacteriota bacterium]